MGTPVRGTRSGDPDPAEQLGAGHSTRSSVPHPAAPTTTVYAPGFERDIDKPEPWRGIRDLVDEAWCCGRPTFGRTSAAAAAWAREVDGANARTIAPSRARADLVVSGVTGEVLRAPGARPIGPE